jgi:signal transduction histidine kinase/CheY-like chemotaxis protein/CHASE3 domain sensor protein
MKSTIKSKLYTGFSVILLLLAVLAAILLRNLSEVNARIEKIVNVSSKRIILSQGILTHVLDAARQEKNLILENEPDKINRYAEKLRLNLQTISIKLVDLQLIINNDEKGIVDDFIRSWKKYKGHSEQIISLAGRNLDDQAFALSISKGYDVREEAILTLNLLVEKSQARMAAEKAKSDESYNDSIRLIALLVTLCLLISLTVAIWIVRAITERIKFISNEAEKIASRDNPDSRMTDSAEDELSPIFTSLKAVDESFKEITVNANRVASGDYSVDITPRSDRDILGISLNQMTRSLREATAENENHAWLTSGQNQLNESLRGDKSPQQLSSDIINFLCRYLNSSVGAFYLVDHEGRLSLKGRYALSGDGTKERIKMGEGLVGQSASEQKIIWSDNIGEARLIIRSSFINAIPSSIGIIPFSFEGKVLGVIEIGALEEFTSIQKEFVMQSLNSIAISINSANSRARISELLEETQMQSEELQSQQEELRQINEELEEQAQSLRQQQEELQMTNEELEEQTQALEVKNREVERTKEDIEEKTRQLEISSRYKSEFLANMSHELRTPLNSLLILSRDLAENKTNNLSEDQVESAEIINKSGHELLSLINEVLDLSKIEAGKMALNIERIPIREFVNDLQRSFKRHAESKSLDFRITVEENMPEHILSDRQRLTQILKNLLSNAIKFTAEGEVELELRKKDDHIAFSVKDTGIGIPDDKQAVVFEAFHQGDGGTSRKYGGTGLGLSISKELAKLLKGEITLSSKVGKGSEFTLTVPVELKYDKQTEHRQAAQPAAPSRPALPSSNFINYPGIEDDRNIIKKEDKIVLIVEDDTKFATILRNQARNKGFKALCASTGEDGLVLSEKFSPSAVILDIDLPGMNGLQVLAELKNNPALRHIPVHIMSVNERTIEPIKEGAVEYLTKPVDKKQMEEAFRRIESFIERKMKNLLIIEDDANSRRAIRKLIGNGDVKSFEAGSGKEALEVFTNNHIDCIVLDLGLPDTSGFELIHKLAEVKNGIMPPVIIYTGKELTRKENEELEKYAETIIIKGAKSEERLLDETALFLHRTIDKLPEAKRKMITNLYNKEIVFESKKILLVDDDMRNVFALSKVLKEKGMEVLKAENGAVALEELNNNPGVDLVLMDIMMPEMDGYTAMQKIREQSRFKSLPVIALTAKAMKEDKQKCIDAGANDYITKPIDVSRLLSLMRVWLSK